MAKLSIITIVYNGAATLEKTILSIAAQDYCGIEYIVVDGASTDGTLDIIKQYSSVVAKCVSEPDNGLYDAMNKGIAMASGDYLWFINSGDEIYDRQTVSKIFASGVDADIFYGDTVMIDMDGDEIGRRRLTPPENLTWRHFAYGMRVSHQSFICKRSIATKYNTVYRFSADFEWCLLALKKAQVICHTHLILSRFLEGGLTKKNIVPGLKERFRIMVPHFGLVPTILRHFVLGTKLVWFILWNKRF
jgi:glycosyltransferase involved in cell wall biosynthesis